MVKGVGKEVGKGETFKVIEKKGREEKGGRWKERKHANLYRYLPSLRPCRRNIAVSETRAEFRMGPCTSSQWKVSAFDPPSSLLFEASRIVVS